MEQEHIIVKQHGKEYIVSKDKNGNFPQYINIPAIPDDMVLAHVKPSCYCNVRVVITVLKLVQYLGPKGLYYAYK